jgi:hypothetical protein
LTGGGTERNAVEPPVSSSAPSRWRLAGGWRPSRTLLRGVGILALLVVSQVVAVHAVVHFGGPGLHPKAILSSLRAAMPRILLLFAAGVVARAGYEAWRGRLRDYLRRIATPNWLVASAVLVLCAGLTVHAYAYLKLLVPLINPASFDEALWTIDRWLFFGLSPNVFLLTLFSEPALLRAIDWSYGKLYFPVMLAFPAFFLSLRSNRLRFAIGSGFAGLWLAGAWLYLLLPSLGPCYAFSKLWDASREMLPTSHLAQIYLMDNYTKVLRIPQGMTGMNAVLGIAAFPSLHVAAQLYIALWVRRLAPSLGFPLLLTVAVLFVGSIVTGWHYMVDSVAGLAMAWGAYRLTALAWGIEGWRKGSGSVARS